MPKSLAMSSNGLDFDSFIKALVSVPKVKAEKQTRKKKRKKIAPPAGGLAL